MPFEIEASAAAARVIARLKGDAAKRWLGLRQELVAQGCRAAGYRLLARDGGASEYCCKHLDRTWRVVATFEPSVVVVVAVGRHDGPAFYAALSKHYEIREIGQRRDNRPACCGEDGWPTLGTTRASRTRR